MTVRMDSQLKSSFDELCSQFGMSANTAMTIFAKAVVQRGRIPFDIRGDKYASSADEGCAYGNGYQSFRKLRALAESGAFPEMSLEEINEEIKQSRASR